MLKVEILPILCNAIDYPTDQRSVLRVSSVKYELQRRFSRRLVCKYAKGLLGPVNFATRSIPAETARVA
jgi:hypothetical protein